MRRSAGHGWATGSRRSRQGLDTHVGEEGAGLSGGQSSGSSLARALLADAPVLLLDEPTAHLDPPTARALMDDVLDVAGGERCC